MTPIDRIVLVAVAALLILALLRGVRWWLDRRLERLRGISADSLWQSLALTPDGRPLVVAFSSPGCAVCRTAQRPALRTVERASEYHPRIVAIDVSERPRVAETFGVLTVPSTVVLAPGGQVVAANHGFAPADVILEQVSRAAS